ncbi:MAG: beta strand repeat-containing protein [Thermoleophilia bacterium]
MQASSKLLSRTAIILLGLLLATMLFVVLNSQQAKALQPSQWETVRGYINSFYGGVQSTGAIDGAALDGEAGFRRGKVALWNELDSNGDIQPNAGAGVGNAGTAVTGVLGEGDDMANRPVLIDNLMKQPAFIPGTEFRCHWNDDQSCFADSSITAIRQIVDNHKAAGFSTDIVDYCVSSQTAGPSTGGFGIIAQVPGALSSDTSLIPKVYIADYSRNGWRNNLATASGTGAIASPETSAGGLPAPGTPPGTVAPSSCDSAATDLALVECQANWAIWAGGGNTGNGTFDMSSTANVGVGGAGQSVDVRTGTISTLSTAGTNLQIPISTLFSTAGLANLDPTKSTVLAGRTQMGETSAIGLRMLGYTLIPGGSISTGISRWNGTQGEAQVAYGPGLPLQAVDAYSAPAKVDTTGPSISSGPTISNITATSADVTRTAGEPATSKIDLTGSGGAPAIHVNSTVLNAVHTSSLSGLIENTHYTGTLTVYDGYANGTTAALDFWTDVTAPTISNVSPANAATVYTASPTVSATLADNGGGSGINVDPAVTMAHVDGTMIMSGCTINATSISCPTSGLNSGAGLAYGAHTLEIMTADNAGNPATTSSTTFNVGDNVAPVPVYVAPTGSSNNASPTITGTVTDAAPSSGLPASATLNLSNDGGATWPSSLQYSCTITSGNISCPVTGVLPGSPAAVTYNAKITVVDNATNSGSTAGTDTFTVDTTAPTVTPAGFDYHPSGSESWTKNQMPALSAAISDVPSGQNINPATASVTIDDSACASAKADNNTISCTPASNLAEGDHTVIFSAEFNAGHPGTGTQTVHVDLTAPGITNMLPTGNIQTASPTLSAALADYGSGINASASAVYLDGPGTALTNCPTRTNAAIGCVANVTAGPHTFSVYAEDNVGNGTLVSTGSTGSFTLTQINYFWTWYDNIWGDDWVLLGNANPSGDVNYSLSVHGAIQTLPGGGMATPGNLITPKFSGMMGGPVKATSTTGTDGLLSQRILWPKGGSSLEEVPAVKESDLSDHYYWTWYDEQSLGYKDWVLVANTNAAADVYYQVKVDGVVKDSGTLAAGASVTPHFPGLIGGPVEVQGWTDATMTTAAKLMASQRVLSNGGSAINEVPGIPNEKLSSHYLWTWYDQTIPGNRDWVLIANPRKQADGTTDNTADMYYTITINGAVAGTGGPIAPGSKVTPMFDMGIGGPVDVQTFSDAAKTAPLRAIASQRVTWGPSFEEVPGYNFSDLKNDYKWTWYDMQSAGARNWVLVVNTNSSSVYYEVTVNGIPRASGDIAANKDVIPALPGIMGGPVEVKAWTDSGKSTPANVMTSQRVLWNGYFNETLGQ